MPNWNNAIDWQNTLPGAGSGPLIGNFIGDNNAASIPGSTAVTAGDSIAIARAVVGNNTSLYDYSFFAWFQTLAGQPFVMVNDGAVGGSTTASCLANLETNVLRWAPDWCFLHIGTNDIGTDVPVATIKANLTSIFRILRANNIVVVALSVIPYGPGYSLLSAARNIARHEVNSFIAQTCAATPGMVFVDSFAAMVDPVSSTGAARADYTRDLLHPSGLGARAIGKAIQSALANHYAPAQPLVSAFSDNFDYDATAQNRLSNPLFSGAGPVATSWNGVAGGSASSTNSVVSRADGIGSNQRCVILSSANNDTYSVRTGSISSRFSSGQTLYGEAEVSVSSASNLKGVRILATHTVDGVVFNWTGMSNQASSASLYDQADWVGVLRTPEYIVPPGATLTSTILTIDAVFAGAGGATIEVGRASWRRK